MRKYVFLALSLFLAILLTPFSLHTTAYAQSEHIYLYDFVGEIEFDNGEYHIYHQPTDVSFGSGLGIVSITVYPYLSSFYEIKINEDILQGEFEELEYGCTYTVRTSRLLYYVVIRPIETEQETYHTVSFYDSDDNLLNTTSVVDNSIIADIPIAPILAGYTFAGWRERNTYHNFDFDNAILSDIDLLACYIKDTVEHTVSFYDSDDNLLNTTSVVDNSMIADIPIAPILAGYTFAGWRERDAYHNFNFDNAILSDIDLFAYYIKDTVEHTVSFYDSDDNLLNTTSVVDNSIIADIPIAPILAGYTFVGWRERDAYHNFNFDNAILSDIDLFAYYEINIHTVIFVIGYGHNDCVVYVPYGEDAIAPDIPSEIGNYIFSHWDTKYTDIRQDSIITAVYQLEYAKVDFLINDDICSVKVKLDSLIPEYSIPEISYSDGLRFVGWFDVESNELFDTTLPIQHDITLYPKYEPVYHQVILDYNGGVVDDKSREMQYVRHGESAIYPQLPPHKEGYTFTGWDWYGTITEDMLITAIYKENYYTIVFYHSSGEIFRDYEINHGQVLTNLPNYTPDKGYNFEGWYLADGSTLTPPITITAPLKFYPKVSRVLLSISYFYNGLPLESDNLTEASIGYGEKFSTPSAPPLAGYEFVGWFIDSGLTKSFDATLAIVEDLSLHASYQKVIYDIFTNTSQGVQVDIAKTAYFKDIISYSYTIPEGYEIKTFSITDANGNDIVFNEDFFEMPSSDIVFTIVLHNEKYDLYIDIGDGQIITTKYGEYIDITAATKDNAIFVGWFFDKSHTQPFDNVVYGKAGDTIYLFAKFIAEDYYVNLVTPSFICEVNGKIFHSSALPQDALVFQYKSIIDGIEAPTIDGYNFVAWYYDEDYQHVFTSCCIEYDFTLYGKYTIKKHTVTFEYGMGEREEMIYEHFQMPLPPTHSLDFDYSKFAGWDKNISNITSDTTFIARYIDVYDNYYYHDNTLLLKVRDVMSLSPAINYDIPTKKGYTFIGFMWTSTVGKAVNYQAVFDKNSYTISINNCIGGTIFCKQVAGYAETVTLNLALSNNYQIKKIAINNAIGLTKINDTTFSFIMPDSDVAINLQTSPVASQDSPHDVPITIASDNNIKVGNVQHAFSHLASGDVDLSVKMLPENNKGNIKGLTASLHNQSILSTFNIAISAIQTIDNDIRHVQFAEGSSLLIRMALPSNISSNAKLYVCHSSDDAITYYDCYLGQDNGVTYVHFKADRAGEYTLVATMEQNKLSPREWALIAVCSIMFIVMVGAVIKKLGKGKKSLYSDRI